jgi:hypothetical protein
MYGRLSRRELVALHLQAAGLFELLLRTWDLWLAGSHSSLALRRQCFLQLPRQQAAEGCR